MPSGVVYGFLGPNGAGKTTTMRLITGLIHPDAANAVVATSGGGGFGGDGAGIARLEPNTALIVVLAWLVGALVVTALFTERAEISG